MKIIKVSDFFRVDVDPFVLGVFYSRTQEAKTEEKKYIYTYTDFNESKFSNSKLFDFDSYVDDELKDDLNAISSPKLWVTNSELQSIGIRIRKHKAYMILENDLNISLKSFFDKLYFKILNMNFVLDDKFNHGKADFIRGFIETRGSVDTTAAFISNDYYYNSAFELKKVRILTERMSVPSNVINLNFRNLQKQFREGKKRNPQLRINIHWYASKVGFVNKYKSYLYSIVHHNSILTDEGESIIYYLDAMNPDAETINTQFSNYLDLYSDHIYNKELDKLEVNRLRKKLNFNSVSNTNISRNQSIIKLFRELSEDICAGCDTKVTSTSKNTGRQNFEIHHFIPFKNNEIVLDTMDNLVKLCPTCHDTLKKGRATPSEQTILCETILSKNESLYDFASSYLEIEEMNEIAKKVQKLLQ